MTPMRVSWARSVLLVIDHAKRPSEAVSADPYLHRRGYERPPRRGRNCAALPRRTRTGLYWTFSCRLWISPAAATPGVQNASGTNGSAVPFTTSRQAATDVVAGLRRAT